MIIFNHGAKALLVKNHLTIEDTWSYSDTFQSVGLLWTSDRADAESST